MRKLFLIMFLLNTAIFANDSVFDNSANLYINGKLPEAARLIQTALQANPSDEKLRTLLDKIREEMEKEKENSEKQNSEDQQKEEQEKEQEQQQGEEEQEKDPKEEEKEEQQAEQEKQDEENKDPQEKKEQPQAQAAEEDKINKEEAERILNALRADEQESQKKKAPVRGSRRARGKDW